MNLVEKLAILKSSGPLVIGVTSTYDMGYEFSAVVPHGVIYPVPGMLIDYSGGEWPPHTWEYKDKEELNDLLAEFLLDSSWSVTPWNDLSDDEIHHWFEMLQQETAKNQD